MEDKPLIEINQLVKTYTMAGEVVPILKEISFSIEQGEFVAIVGPSGSGKSALMNMIGCLDIPSSGSYLLDGQEVSSMSENRQAQVRNEKIGFIFQSFNLLPKLSALENVELPLIYRGISQKERHAMAELALTNVGLADRTHHKPMQLSGGQQQRVAIARALAGDPPILLADEPTGALDTKTGKEIMQMLHDLNAKGHTIIVITHDPEIANQAKRVIRIQDGQITEDRGVAS
ncbi:ABC transporter ATP-binding protein [Paenibacillus sp. N1-5-1-14]|uniref:ABC transporter ATP-binding protein n=1 Tax=Paenibacillus radicibacter TaxID=2972488 RepID=UPI002158C7F7|nr:ABC transporter ATP-binding protein [Paenibacillus radicibacter]MCR8644010.1 ABC transporter ATP-binding protein [Paenibacillus radicibacter]